MLRRLLIVALLCVVTHAFLSQPAGRSLVTKTGLKMEVRATSALGDSLLKSTHPYPSSLTTRQNAVHSRRFVKIAMGRAQEEGGRRTQGQGEFGGNGHDALQEPFV